MADSLATIVSAETTIGRPSPTTRRLVNASVSDNTRRAYALGQLDAWLDGLRLGDAALAAYLRSAPRRRRDRWTRARPCPWVPTLDLERMIVNPRWILSQDGRGDRALVTR